MQNMESRHFSYLINKLLVLGIHFHCKASGSVLTIETMYISFFQREKGTEIKKGWVSTERNWGVL
jgi:hypothetical protein